MTPIPETPAPVGHNETGIPVDGFLAHLKALEDGQFSIDADDALTNLLRDLHKAEQRGAKPKGELTIKLTIVMQEGMVDTTVDLKVTKPRIRRPRTIRFANANGEFIGEVPKQLKLFDQGTAPAAAPVAAVVVPAAPVAVQPMAPAPVDVHAAPVAPVPYTMTDALVDAAAGVTIAPDTSHPLRVQRGGMA